MSVAKIHGCLGTALVCDFNHWHGIREFNIEALPSMDVGLPATWIEQRALGLMAGHRSRKLKDESACVIDPCC
jgi:hypothetical protein